MFESGLQAMSFPVSRRIKAEYGLIRCRNRSISRPGGRLSTGADVPDDVVKAVDSEDGTAANLRPLGRLAQLGERLPYKQEVAGSSPAPPTELAARQSRA